MRLYIHGKPSKPWTDHNSLETVYRPRSMKSVRVTRSVLRLQQYDFKVIHVSGKHNIAESLSRLIGNTKVTGSPDRIDAEEYVGFVAVSATPAALSMWEIERAFADDSDLEAVHQVVLTRRFEQCKSNAPVAGELCMVGKLVLRRTRVVIPQTKTTQMLSLAPGDPLGIVGTKQNMRTKG